MSTFQDIRGRLEAVTADALQAAGIPTVTFDNVQEDAPPIPWASVSLSFTGTLALSLGCVADQITGSVVVSVLTEKRKGSTAGEEATLAVLQAWAALNRDFNELTRIRTFNHQGPVTFEPLNQREVAHCLHTLNCGFTARVWQQPSVPNGAPLLVTHDGSALVTDTGARIAALP
jgi:hypothetical protein